MKKNIFLYKIGYGLTNYFYTNADSSIVYNRNMYSPVPISHSEISNDMTEVAKSSVTVNMGIDTLLANAIIDKYDNVRVSLDIYFLDVNNPTVVTTEYKGVLSKITYNMEELTLKFSNTIYDTQRQGLRLVYQRLCPYALYDNQCRLSKTNHFDEYQAEVYNIDNDYTISSNSAIFTSEYYGGFIELYQHTGDVETFFIKEISSDFKKIITNRRITSKGYKMRIYQGCNKTMARCKVLQNTDNFGGYPLLPLSNPQSVNYKNGGGADKVLYKVDSLNIVTHDDNSFNFDDTN